MSLIKNILLKNYINDIYEASNGFFYSLNRQTKCKRQTKSNCDRLNAKNVVKSIKNSIN